jgi:hypothetical protein
MDSGLLATLGPGMTRNGDQTAAVIHCSSFAFGAAPTWRDASWPSLNSIKVGIDMMPNLAAVPGFSSTLSLTILTLPLSDLEISSRASRELHRPVTRASHDRISQINQRASALASAASRAAPGTSMTVGPSVKISAARIVFPG